MSRPRGMTRIGRGRLAGIIRRCCAVALIVGLLLGSSLDLVGAWAVPSGPPGPGGPGGPGGGGDDQNPPPPGVVNDCSGRQTFYFFRYNDSSTVGVDRGCSEKIDVRRSEVPSLVATLLHISCSDKISSDGVPTKSDLGSSSRRITAYYIQKPDGKSCGFGNPSMEPKVDVGIVKTASQTTVDYGDEVTYTLKVTNASTVTAHDVVVSDVLPSGVTFVSASSPCSYDSSSRRVTCTVGDLTSPTAAPTGSCSGDRETYYRFEYNDSATVGTDVGCSEKIDVRKSEVPSLVATLLHVSCSDKISSDGVPTKSDLGSSSRRIKAYYILRPDGRTCGQGTFTPVEPPTFTITVKVHASHCNEASIATSDHDVDLSNNTSRVCVKVRDRVQTLQAEIYRCVNGQPSTTLISGGTLRVPARNLSTGNPLPATSVPAATYEVDAAVPSAYAFVACGQSNVVINSPTSAVQRVVVPSGGAGDGKFYAVPAPTGYLEVCKRATEGVSGTFSFRTPVGTVNVPAGACSPALKVPAGTVSITEVKKVGFVMAAGSVNPSSRLKSINLSTRTITATVVAGDVSTQTIVTFTNAPATGTIKICQVAGSGVAVGRSFSFTNSANDQTVQVPAGPAPGGYCVPLDATFSGQVTVTQAASGTTVTDIDVEPANRLVRARPEDRTVTVQVDTGVTEVTFTNGS